MEPTRYHEKNPVSYLIRASHRMDTKWEDFGVCISTTLFSAGERDFPNELSSGLCDEEW